MRGTDWCVAKLMRGTDFRFDKPSVLACWRCQYGSLNRADVPAFTGPFWNFVWGGICDLSLESVVCRMLLLFKDWATNLGFSRSKWLQMKLWWAVQPPVCCLTWSGWTLAYFGPWLMGSNIFRLRGTWMCGATRWLCKMLQSVSKHNSKSDAAVYAGTWGRRTGLQWHAYLPLASPAINMAIAVQCFAMLSHPGAKYQISVWSMIDHGTNAGANQELQNDR